MSARGSSSAAASVFLPLVLGGVLGWEWFVAVVEGRMPGGIAGPIRPNSLAVFKATQGLAEGSRLGERAERELDRADMDWDKFRRATLGVAETVKAETGRLLVVIVTSWSTTVARDVGTTVDCPENERPEGRGLPLEPPTLSAESPAAATSVDAGLWRKARGVSSWFGSSSCLARPLTLCDKFHSPVGTSSSAESWIWISC